jgi:type I restriction enzyme S subunit
LIRSQNVFDRRFDSTGLAFISEQQAGELAGAEVEPGDVLLNITGDGITFARACLVPGAVLPACVNQHVVLIRPKRDACEPGFLLSYLTDRRIKPYIESFNAGGSRRAITKGHIEAFEIPLPPITEQRAISRMLGALDDKIELNRRMNETLEATAQALFNSWFVDFDPVRAKAASQTPFGAHSATGGLFPKSFQDSQLGDIPNRWGVGKVGDFVILGRNALNPGEFPEETFDHYSIPAFDEGRTPKVERGETIRSNKFVVLPGCVLISKLNPRIPRIWLPDLRGTHRAVCSTEFLVTSPKPGVTREFIYCLFSSSRFVGVFSTLVTGTSGSHQRVKPENLLEMATVVPPEPVINHFADATKPLLDLANRNIQQSRTLLTLRETLLPKLLSGSVRLGAAKEEVGVTA